MIIIINSNNDIHIYIIIYYVTSAGRGQSPAGLHPAAGRRARRSLGAGPLSLSLSLTLKAVSRRHRSTRWPEPAATPTKTLNPKP